MGRALVVQWAAQLPNGQLVFWLAALLAITFFFGLWIWIFSLIALSASQEVMVKVLVIFLVLVSLHPLLRPFPYKADPDECHFLQTFPQAAHASLLGRLLWNQWAVWCFSLGVLASAAIASTLTKGSNPALVLAWGLYQTTGLGLGLLLKLAVQCCKKWLKRWEAILRSNKSGRRLWTRLVQWLAFATLYFIGGMIAYHVVTWIWQTVRASSGWDVLRLAVGPKLKAALAAALFRPSLFTVGLVIIVLSAVTILLPTLVRVMVRNQQDGEQELETQNSPCTPHTFSGHGMFLIIEKDILHFLRVPRSQTGLSLLAIAFFASGFEVAMAWDLSLIQHPWGLLIACLVGTYILSLFNGDFIRETTGPTAERDQFALYRLAPIHPQSVIWSKVLLSAALMAMPAIAFGVVLGLIAVGRLPWMLAVLLVTVTIPFLEALAHIGVPTFFALMGQTDQNRNRFRAKVLPYLLSTGYFILLLELIGVPAAFQITGKGNVPFGPAWAYAALLVPAIFLMGALALWWQRQLTRH